MFVLVSRRVLYTTFVVKGHARCRVSREAFPIPTPSNFGAHETAGGKSTVKTGFSELAPRLRRARMEVGSRNLVFNVT